MAETFPISTRRLNENSRESIAESHATTDGFSGRSFPVCPIRGHFGAEWRRLTVTREEERRLNTLAVEQGQDFIFFLMSPALRLHYHDNKQAK